MISDKKLKIAIEQFESIHKTMPECANKHIMKDAIDQLKVDNGLDSITWVPRYSSTDEYDHQNRWARIAYNRNDVQIAWVSKNKIDQGDIFTVSPNFPTHANSDTPTKYRSFKTWDESKQFVVTEWANFLNSIS